jgi:uncharacterized protein
MSAVVQALDTRNIESYKHQLSDLLVLSIGTGRVSEYVDGSTLDWGLAKWAPHFVDLIQDAPVDMADFECAQVLGERYHRVQVDLPRKVEPDDQGEIAFLEEVAGSKDVQGLIDEVVSWAKRIDFI